jgi:hypothetical protein
MLSLFHRSILFTSYIFRFMCFLRPLFFLVFSHLLFFSSSLPSFLPLFLFLFQLFFLFPDPFYSLSLVFYLRASVFISFSFFLSSFSSFSLSHIFFLLSYLLIFVFSCSTSLLCSLSKPVPH